MDIKVFSNRVKKLIKRKVRKTKKRIIKLEPDSHSMRKIFLLFMILFFAVCDLAIWRSGSIPNSDPVLVINTGADMELEKNARELASGHPIESMIPYILRKDRKVASYLLAIAKKESNLGMYSPQKDGRDCFNYWGYRGQYNKTDSGYSCFDSRRQAVNVISKRVGTLIAQNIDTPQEMAVWKCGYDCSWDDQANVRKWVEDVGYYYEKIYQ